MKNFIEKRKRKYILEKDFQYRFTLRLSLIGGGLLMAFLGILLYFIRSNYESLRDSALLLMPGLVANLDAERRMLSFQLIGTMLAVVAYLFGLGLVMTSKIAGPLLALQKRISDFADGKEGVRLRLRRNDEFQNLASTFNVAMEASDHRLQEFFERIQSAHDDLLGRKQDSARETLEKLLSERHKAIGNGP